MDRLIANVQRKVSEEPTNAQWRYVLGRLYSMAYVGVEKGLASLEENPRDPGHVYESFGPGLPLLWRGWPYVGKGAPYAPQPDIRKPEYLSLAIQSYRDALRLQPDHLFSWMGLGWCYEESHQLEEAGRVYWKAFQIAWKGKERQRHNIVSGQFMVADLGEALLRVLPTDSPKQAIVLRRMREVGRWIGGISPIILPIREETGFESLVGSENSAQAPTVSFDLIGGGEPEFWSWVTDQAAFLVWDPHQTGQVTSGRQLFGNSTWWIFWSNGYEPLSLLDDDGDGYLKGGELFGLGIWQDKNGNGVSDAGEVKPVEVWGIAGFEVNPTHRRGEVVFHPTGVVFADGTTRPTYDWISYRAPKPRSQLRANTQEALPPPTSELRHRQHPILLE